MTYNPSAELSLVPQEIFKAIISSSETSNNPDSYKWLFTGRGLINEILYNLDGTPTFSQFSGNISYFQGILPVFREIENRSSNYRYIYIFYETRKF